MRYRHQDQSNRIFFWLCTAVIVCCQLVLSTPTLSKASSPTHACTLRDSIQAAHDKAWDDAVTPYMHEPTLAVGRSALARLSVLSDAMKVLGLNDTRQHVEVLLDRSTIGNQQGFYEIADAALSEAEALLQSHGCAYDTLDLTAKTNRAMLLRYVGQPWKGLELIRQTCDSLALFLGASPTARDDALWEYAIALSDRARHTCRDSFQTQADAHMTRWFNRADVSLIKWQDAALHRAAVGVSMPTETDLRSKGLLDSTITDAATLENTGVLLYLMGQDPRLWLQRSLRRTPKDSAWERVRRLCQLGAAENRFGSPKEAIAVLREALATPLDGSMELDRLRKLNAITPNPFDELAVAHLQQGDTLEAWRYAVGLPPLRDQEQIAGLAESSWSDPVLGADEILVGYLRAEGRGRSSGWVWSVRSNGPPRFEQIEIDRCQLLRETDQLVRDRTWSEGLKILSNPQNWIRAVRAQGPTFGGSTLPLPATLASGVEAGDLRKVTFVVSPGLKGVILDRARVKGTCLGLVAEVRNVYRPLTSSMDGAAGPDIGRALVIVGWADEDAPIEVMTLSREAEMVIDILEATRFQGRVDVLRGSSASSEQVLANLGAYDVIHFVGHGTVPHAGTGGGLFLYDGGLTDVDVAKELTLRAELVVLSSCYGADLGDLSFSGIDGVAGALIDRGAKRVVASYGPVAMESSARLYAEFYRRWLAEAQTPETALLGAKRKLARERWWGTTPLTTVQFGW